MVTRASSGIGQDFCPDLAKAGCRIIAAARRVDRLRSLCTEINKGPVIELSVQKAWDAFGRVDALINNAGERCHIINNGKSSAYQSVHTPLDLAEEEWDDIIKTNSTGTWLVSKFVCTHTCDAKCGGLACVCSKTAVNSMTKVMALELGAYKIKVNSISRGLLKSEITQGLVQKEWLKRVEWRTTPLRTSGTTDPRH